MRERTAASFAAIATHRTLPNMATRKQTEAVEAIDELADALDAAHEAPEPSEARLRFLNGEITWDELMEAGG